MTVRDAATLIGIVPLVWLAVLHWFGQRRDARWWWIAAALGVSFLADVLARWWNPVFIESAYIVSQAGIVCAVLLDREETMDVIALLLATGTVAALWQGPATPDVLLSTIANGAVAVVAWRATTGRLRLALVIAFGLAGLCWLALPARRYYCGEIRACLLASESYALWYLYHGVRLAGAVAFCWAALHPAPQLTLARNRWRAI